MSERRLGVSLAGAERSVRGRRGKSGSEAEAGENPNGRGLPGSAEAGTDCPGGVPQGGRARPAQAPSVGGLKVEIPTPTFRGWHQCRAEPQASKLSWEFQKPGAERSVWPGRCRRGKGRGAERMGGFEKFQGSAPLGSQISGSLCLLGGIGAQWPVVLATWTKFLCATCV